MNILKIAKIAKISKILKILKISTISQLRNVTFIILLSVFSTIMALDYNVVDTGQTTYFNNLTDIAEPVHGDDFYGQDANNDGNQPSYTDNGDGTITDNVTGLMWTKTCDTDGDGDIDVDDKMSYEEAMASTGNINTGGYDDWRIPTLKEQYSLIIFSGIDPSGYNGSTDGLIPFIDTDYFDFAYGDESAGERIIDAQMVTSTLYVATIMNGDESMFGVNFADGRIKGYGTGPMPGSPDDKQFYVYYVRGNTQYGINDYQVNGDGTISDNATGLMWSQNDSEEGMDWEAALAWVQQKNEENYLGYSDWRLPDVKELQSIVDYTRSPETSNSAAIDPAFQCTEITNAGDESDYPFYWSSTTHENWTENNGGFASYVSFGRALGWMEEPPMSGNYLLMDVHGAGSQRSDPKAGDPDDYPYGHGPQGDVIRIFNYVRLVRDFEPETSSNDSNLDDSTPEILKLSNYPNPFNPLTTINYQLDDSNEDDAAITIYNLKGQVVKEYSNLSSEGAVVWNGVDNNGSNVPSGIYFYQVDNGLQSETRKMMLMK